MMKRNVALALCPLLIVVALWQGLAARQQPAPAATAAATAARQFLASLTPDQRTVAALPYGDAKKATWHNLPPQLSPRAGVTLGSLTPPQREAAMRVLASILSPYGMEKVRKTMDADLYLGTDIGAGFPTGPDAYSLAIYGEPSPSEPWAVQFNGHHLGLNVAIRGRDHVMAPSLTGAYPAVYPRDGKMIRVLGEETDRGFALIGALAREAATPGRLPFDVPDLILGPGKDGKMIEPEGVKGSALSRSARQQLLSLIDAWVGIMSPAAATAKMAEVTNNLPNTYFAWSGGTTPGSNVYFRVQGPTLFIEYATQGNPGGRGGRPGGAGAAPAPPPVRDPNHLHTVYRDFSNDYGLRHTR
jgi:hypothetical protein